MHVDDAIPRISTPAAETRTRVMSHRWVYGLQEVAHLVCISKGTSLNWEPLDVGPKIVSVGAEG